MLSDQGFWFAVCRNLHYCSTACNCFVITTYCSSHYSKKKSVACSNFHLDCYWKVFLQVLAASDLATIRCPGVPCWFALQSQRRVLMQEGHKPSVSKQGDRICCHVLLPHVVCLQEGAIWLCVCVCVAKGHGPGWRDRAYFIPNDYWVCLTRWQPAESTWLALRTAPRSFLTL